LQNLVSDPRNTTSLSAHKQLERTIIDVLEAIKDDQTLPSTADTLVEIQIVLLDILELIAPTIVLRPPPAPGTAILLLSSLADEMNVPDETDPACRFFPCLALRCLSSDRAIALAAFKALASLAGSESVSEQNEPVFTFSCAIGTAPNPITRALELLPIEDLDLSTAMLDLLYSYTQIPSNADCLAARPDLLYILTLLLNKLAIGTTRDDTEVEPLKEAAERIKQRNQLRASLKDELEKKYESRIPLPELQLLLPVKEPLRTVRW